MLYIASDKSEMTDIDKYYVYTGEESDMLHGHWYFWNGSEWIVGGKYEWGIDDIFETDLNMTNPAMPANSKAVGDRFDRLDQRIDMIQKTGLLVEGVTITPIQSTGTRFNLAINKNE